MIDFFTGIGLAMAGLPGGKHLSSIRKKVYYTIQQKSIPVLGYHQSVTGA
jgi:hypothetical protein